MADAQAPAFDPLISPRRSAVDDHWAVLPVASCVRPDWFDVERQFDDVPRQASPQLVVVGNGMAAGRMLKSCSRERLKRMT